MMIFVFLISYDIFYDSLKKIKINNVDNIWVLPLDINKKILTKNEPVTALGSLKIYTFCKINLINIRY